MSRRSRVVVPEQQRREAAAEAERSPERYGAHAQQASSPAMQRRIRQHAEPVQGDRQRETRTRSWRAAKRLEDNTPAEPEEDAVVDGDITGRVIERSEEMLAEAQDLLELDDGELAVLFDVASPAVERWRRRGVPAGHGERLACIHQIVLTLRSHGRERSVAELARLPVPEADGASVLDLLQRQPIDMEAVTAACVAVQSRGPSRSRLPVEPMKQSSG